MSEKKAETADLSALRIDHGSESEHKSNETRIRTFMLIAVAVAVAVVVILVYILGGNSQSSPAYKLFEVKKINPVQSEAILTASGYVVAQRQAAIASKGTGRLELLRVEEGDEVQAGQLIAQLEHEDVDAALAQAKANLRMSEANHIKIESELHEATLNHERQKGLMAKGLISQAEYDIAEARFKSAKATVLAAKAEVEFSRAVVVSAEVNVENTRIRAPFDGTVLSKNADVGEMVAPFAASASSRGAVVTIADMSSLEVEADVSESNIQKVRTGLVCEITLDAFPSVRYPGYVHKIVPTADRAKATVLTKIRFKERDSRVLPEMSAKVNFLANSNPGIKSEPVTAVPQSSVLKRNDREVVFTVNSNRATETPIQTGRKFGTLVEILQGVVPGDLIVLNPTDDLKAGSAVSVK